MEEKVLNGKNVTEAEDAEDAGELVCEGDGDVCESGEAIGLQEENERLRGELACVKAGVPGEIAGDIAALAAEVCRKEGCVLEEAV
ncbi:MAG: hypothetical protein NC078_12050, partial [Ruminococcus sp.]|nr:hypothetical protein [Ruminococcus sp.]